MVVTMSDDYYRQRTAMASRRVRRESDARRDLERIHLMTIRREKMRLQDELDRVRVNRHNTTATKNAKLLSNRFGAARPESSRDDGRRGTRGDMTNASQREKQPYRGRKLQSTGTSGQLLPPELPQIGVMPSPIKGELDFRRRTDEFRDPNTKINELKKSEGIQKSLLSLKVDKFNRSLSPVSPIRRSPLSRSPIHSPTARPEARDGGHGSPDSDIDTRATFPPQSRRKSKRTSISNFDVTDAKQSINKRLIPQETDDVINNEQGNNRTDEPLPFIGQTAQAPQPRRPNIIRRESQVAILERNDLKKNKYAPTSNTSPTNNSPNSQTNSKKTAEADLTISILGRDAKRVKEIIENPQFVFDQEKYAPDGSLRTVHMLPDADTAYSQARTARYLRWRDPNEMEYDKELTINEIFSKK